jgi:hypothetical protein
VSATDHLSALRDSDPPFGPRSYGHLMGSGTGTVDGGPSCRVRKSAAVGDWVDAPDGICVPR